MYREAPAGSPSTDPKFPCGSIERVAQREVLRHPHQGVVDRRVAVRVVLAHDAADDVGRLPVRPVGAQALLEHRPEDPAVDRLQAVAHVGERAADDDRHRVVEVGALDLLLELDGLDAAREQVLATWAPGLLDVEVLDVLRVGFDELARDGTSSPISTVNRRSAVAASSSVTCSRVRRSGSIVVSHSCEASISARPLNRCGSSLRPLPLAVRHVVPLALGVEVPLLLAVLHQVQRRLREVDEPGVDQLAHVPEEEREQQRADVGAVDVGVGHDHDPVVPGLLQVELLADAGADRGDERLDLEVLERSCAAGPSRRSGSCRGWAGWPGVAGFLRALRRAAGRVALHDVQLARARDR